MPNAQAVVEHLRPHCQVVRPVRLTFDGKQVIEGAYYEQECTPPEGARNPEPYVRQGFQLVEPPKCYVKRTKREPKLIGTPIVIIAHKVCFVLEGMDTPHEWYVASYYLGEVNEQQPLGQNCLLGAWSIEGEKIDDYEPKPYRRVPVKVEFLD